MKHIKLMAIVMTVAVIMLPGLDSVYARGGGGGHGGGGHGGGGHGGGGHGGGGWHGGGRGDHGHGRWNRYNNVYGAVGYDDGWGYGASDESLSGFDSDTYVDDSTDNSTVIVEQPPIQTVQQPMSSVAPIGAQVTTLPPGSEGRSVGGAQLYQCGDAWYKPYFGASGVYYEVVPQPAA